MSLFEKLPEQDKKAINDWIEVYAFENIHLKDSVENHAPLDYLLRIWDKEKSHHLYKLLGEQFIIKKEVLMELSPEQLREDFKNALQNEPAIKNFKEEFMAKVNAGCFSLDHRSIETLENLFSPVSLVNNKTYNYHTYTYTNKDTGEAVRLEGNMKLMRAFSRFAKVFDINGFEKFRQFHSLVLNQKQIKGTLCLSIHPLDFMTMSDNENGWESCMNWRYGGEYCQGTIEMMNSPNVLMAYVESSSTKMHIPGGSDWNSKKWRQLFVLNEDLFVNVKGYPYQSDLLTNYVLDWLKELAETNLGITYPVMRNFNDSEVALTEKCFIYFDTTLMYNDFGYLPDDFEHHIYMTEKFMDLAKDYDGDIHVMYSGMSECMYCGDASLDDGDTYFDTDMRACFDCIIDTTCCMCGRRLETDDEINEYMGSYYCTECFFETYGQDAFSEEYYPYDQLIEIAVSRYTSGYDDNNTFSFLAHDIKSVPNIEEFFTNGFDSIHHYSGNEYYVNWPEMTPLAWKGLALVDCDKSNFLKEYLKDYGWDEFPPKPTSSIVQGNYYI